jgi:hypothetical protein
MTEVQVGSEKVEKFLVRKDLAIRHSRVIEKALDPESDWKEAEENVVRLPKETPEAFQAFLDVTGNRRRTSGSFQEH